MLSSKHSDPQGPLLAKSSLSMSASVLGLWNQIHLSSLIPSATGIIIEALSMDVNRAIRVFIVIKCGHWGRGRSWWMTKVMTIAANEARAMRQLNISINQKRSVQLRTPGPVRFRSGCWPFSSDLMPTGGSNFGPAKGARSVVDCSWDVGSSSIPAFGGVTGLWRSFRAKYSKPPEASRDGGMFAKEASEVL